MRGMNNFHDFLQSVTSQTARSSALAPLGWLAGILISGCALLFWAKAPIWLSASIGIIGGLVAIPYCVAYFYFMKRNPDALRSEKFHLQKLALERGLIGDDKSGLFMPIIEGTSSNQKIVGMIPADIDKPPEHKVLGKQLPFELKSGLMIPAKDEVDDSSEGAADEK